MISVPLDNAIDFHNPLTITWYYGPTADGPWYEAGQSSNQVYVLLGAPQTAPLYHTLVHLGCENAAGETTESGAVKKIWQEFTDQAVLTVNTKLLKYWHEGKAEGLVSTADLLREANGQCGAWAEFFMDMLKAQHISSTIKIEIFEDSDPGKRGFLVKDWSFIGMGLSPGTPPYNYIQYEDVFDKSGVKGQGNPNPPGGFRNHYIVKYIEQFYDPVDGQMKEVRKYYDPSYGTGPFYSQNEWENASLDGFTADGIFNGKIVKFVKPNDPDVEETLFVE